MNQPGAVLGRPGVLEEGTFTIIDNICYIFATYT